MNKDYEVGYKKPPTYTQFKPGASGNPKGRPKGIKNLTTDLSEELEEKVLINEGGKQSSTTKQRALIKSLVAKGLKGDVRAANVLIQLIVGLEQARGAHDEETPLADEDQAILAEFRERLLSDMATNTKGTDS
jgi:hypothetical protein